TFHSCACGVLPSVSIVCSQFLFEVTVTQLYPGFELRATADPAAGHSPLSTTGAVQRRKRAYPAHFAGSIAVTLIVSPLSVPVTFTFCPANSSGFFWSES